MYRNFYKLRDRPFQLSPDPKFLVETESHREALSHLEYAIASRKGITVLIGEAGTGKTTVIRTALGRQPAQTHYVHLENPVLSRAEFVEILASKFGLSLEARASKAAFLLELESLLTDRHARGETTVLVVDEAQSVPLDLLEELRLLANIETTDGKLLSVVLAGQPELAARLNGDNLRQLKQRIALRCELRPLEAYETLAYVAGRIRAAGGTASQVFTREAVTLMHARARGIPRVISVIADNALVSGFALNQRPVPAATVREVCSALDLPGAEDDTPESVLEPPPTTGESLVITAPPEPVHTESDRPHVLTFAAATHGRPSADDDRTPLQPAAAEGPATMFSTLVSTRRRLFRFF